MRRLMSVGAIGLLLAAAGCAAGPLSENPALVRVPGAACANSVLINPGEAGPDVYANVFDAVLDVVDDYFEVARANRYDGTVETQPLFSPGYDLILKPGSPDSYERLLATTQPYRNRCLVTIRPADEGGYLVGVTVLKELEDLPQPATSLNRSVFQDGSTLQRQYEVVDPTNPVAAGWIPKGRDTAFEQLLLRRIQAYATGN